MRGGGQGRERVRERMRAADEYKAADASPETATRDSVRIKHQSSCIGSFEVAFLRREPCGRVAVLLQRCLVALWRSRCR